jgi:chitinase
MRNIPTVSALLALSATGLACGSASSGAHSETPDGGSSDGNGIADAGSPRPGTDGGKPASEGGTSRDSASPATDAEAGAPSGAWVMGYFSNWDDAANGGFYSVSSIDWSGLTHVAAAFYIPNGSGGWAPGNFDSTLAAPLISAAHTAGKKAIASIGGSGSGPAFEGSTSSGNMTTFLGNLQDLLTMGFDGLDIDWEGGNLSTVMDQALETALIGSLRSKNPTAILTMTAGYENENSLDDLTFYGTISAQLDRINLMTYGMSGAWEGWDSWHSSPLHWNKNTSTPTGIDSSVSHYLAAGVPAGKLGVGAGFYGECYTSPVTAPVQSLGASQVAASDGTMAYRNILSMFYSSSAYHYDSAADVPYLTLSGSNAEKCTYLSYEDATSIAAKAAWVKSQGLGGIIIWTISEGFVASGGTVEEQNPLIEAMKGVF